MSKVGESHIDNNPVDTYLRSGTYTRKPDLPYTPGTDAAGEVEAVSPGSPFKPGDRVYTYGAMNGVYADKAVVEFTRAFPLTTCPSSRAPPSACLTRPRIAGASSSSAAAA